MIRHGFCSKYNFDVNGLIGTGKTDKRPEALTHFNKSGITM